MNKALLRAENKQIVQYHDFDIFGTQECFIHQLKDMKEAGEL